ncbi:MAG: tRNA dimethylallyltransferase [Planctomycetota bacterium]|jgi:tRNA dimethylallyltransferase
MTDSSLDADPLLVLIGATATGKTALALDLAQRHGAEIVSLDSMLVYRGMDIGTAKPDAQEQARAPHHMLDLVGPDERYDVQRYLREAEQAVAGILARGKRALFVGGTGFYLAALLRGLFEGPEVDAELRARLEQRAEELGSEAFHTELAAVDPESAERLHHGDVRRVVRAFEVLEQTGKPLSQWQQEWRGRPNPRLAQARVLGLTQDTAILDERIAARTEVMLAAGWREEALAIRADPGFGASAIQALGYNIVLDWADGKLERAEAAQLIALRTRQFARRQRTWFRKFEVNWLQVGASENQELARAAFDL